MNDRYLYRAKRTDNGEWVEGYLVYDNFDHEYRIVIELDYSTGYLSEKCVSCPYLVITNVN